MQSRESHGGHGLRREDISHQVQRRISPRVLLTLRAQKYLRKGITLGQSLCCHPYVWDEAKSYPEYTTSRKQIAGWVFNVVFTVAHFIFLVVQNVRVNTSLDENAITKALTIFGTLISAFSVLCHATVLWAGKELTDYVRSFLSYSQQFEGQASS